MCVCLSQLYVCVCDRENVRMKQDPVEETQPLETPLPMMPMPVVRGDLCCSRLVPFTTCVCVIAQEESQVKPFIFMPSIPYWSV